MAKEELIVIQDSDLTNNCPECFNQELRLRFYQKHKFNKLYHRITAEVSQELKCKTCESIIYPVKWDNNTENAFNYYQKMVQPEKTSIRFTTLFYILVIIVLLLIGAGIYFILEGVPEF
ncbi:MAG: hypothetical protein KJN76_03835 [Eudoraea sp.]|nr:hypothetical protein [Eudoraea sp.]